MDRASHRATGSGRAIARFFGNSSPKSICTTVANSRARTAPMPMLTPVGIPMPPSMRAQRLADERLGDVADEQPGDGDAQLGAGQHERGAPGDRQRPLRGGVTGGGPGAELRAVDRHVGELLGHEVAGDRGDHERPPARRGAGKGLSVTGHAPPQRSRACAAGRMWSVLMSLFDVRAGRAFDDPRGERLGRVGCSGVGSMIPPGRRGLVKAASRSRRCPPGQRQDRRHDGRPAPNLGDPDPRSRHVPHPEAVVRRPAAAQ